VRSDRSTVIKEILDAITANCKKLERTFSCYQADLNFAGEIRDPSFFHPLDSLS
jgi:hypothetical protein